MMKTEYERRYQWTPPDGDYYSQNLKNKNNPTEPIMTHKRRVKVTEDNVIIGEPLPTQAKDVIKEDPYFVLGDKTKKFYPSVPYRNMKAFNKNKEINKHNKSDDNLKRKIEKFKLKKNREIDYQQEYTRKHKFVNEAVQTENNENLIPVQTKQSQKMRIENLKDKNVKDIIISKETKKKIESNISPAPLQTEYQTKYAWKEPLAKQIQERDKISENQSKLDMKLKIYNNFISEYQRQFRPYEIVNENRFKRMKPAVDPTVDSNLQIIPERRDVPRRALTPPPRFTYQKKSKPPQETMNPQRMSFPHGKQKRFLTEYSANFDNKWNRIAKQEEEEKEEENIRQSNQQSKWFKEILELRKKAQEYRQKSRGTHFSREHFGEIFTKSDKEEFYSSENDRRSRRHRNNKSPEKSDEGFDRMRRRSSVEETIVTPSSVYSSSVSTVVGKLSRNSNSRSPEPRNQNWLERSAGKPSYDNNLLLDEEASHDTDYKDDVRYSREISKFSMEPPRQFVSSIDRPEKKFTLQKYFNETDGNRTKNMRTIDYDSVSKNSSASKMSSLKSEMSIHSSRSLALETLEKARRNQDLNLNRN